MRDIIIVGAGGLGREIQWLIEHINEHRYPALSEGQVQGLQQSDPGQENWNIIGYCDDGKPLGTHINGYEVICNTDNLAEWNGHVNVVCAIGSSPLRKKIIDKLCMNNKLEFPNLIDPSVICPSYCTMGRGNIICAGSILTTNISIGDFCIINPDCKVGHDVCMESFVTLYPSVNVCGTVNIGICSQMGVASCVIQCKNIGGNTFIGAGAVVIDDIPDNVTAVGVPAKVIHIRSDILNS